MNTEEIKEKIRTAPQLDNILSLFGKQKLTLPSSNTYGPFGYRGSSSIKANAKGIFVAKQVMDLTKYDSDWHIAHRIANKEAVPVDRFVHILYAYKELLENEGKEENS